MRGRESCSFGVFSLVIFLLCNGLVPIAQLSSKAESSIDFKQESLKILKAKESTTSAVMPSWIHDYISPGRFSICPKSHRSKEAEIMKLKVAPPVPDTQIEPPEQAQKIDSKPLTHSRCKANPADQIFRNIHGIPKNHDEIRVLSSNISSEEEVTSARAAAGTEPSKESPVESDLDRNNATVMGERNLHYPLENKTSHSVVLPNIPNDTVVDHSEPKPPLEEAESTKAEPTEHMPSFDEWKKEKLEEEKMKDQSSNGGNGKVKPKATLKKNYAGADCGAKILATNPESHNSNYILNNQRDEYMLNPCQVKIWFIVELCEAVQPHTLEIANFELYSSLLKDFTIYASERYPSREWTLLGQYELINELGAQKYTLPDQIFAKYIKVEFSSHHGTEHFCILSKFRIYGTSMVDEIEGIETGESSNELDDDSPLGKGTSSTQSESNFLGTAKNVVYKIVEKATNVITGGKVNDHDGNSTEKLNNGSVGIHHPSIRSGLNLALDELSFSNITNLLYELNKTFGLIDYTGSPNYLSLSFLSRLSQILATCSTCRKRTPSLMKLPVESSLNCKYLQAILGSVRFSILCRLFKLYCRPAEQTQVSLKNFPGSSIILFNTFHRYFCSSVLGENYFICSPQGLNETESMKTFIKDQKFSSKFKAQKVKDLSNSSMPPAETQIENTIELENISGAFESKSAEAESVDVATSESSQPSMPSTKLADDILKLDMAKADSSDDAIFQKPNIVLPSAVTNSASESSFILIETSSQLNSDEESKIQTRPLSVDDAASASLIQPSRSTVHTEAADSPSSKVDVSSTASSIISDIPTLSEAKPSLSSKPTTENAINQSPNTSRNTNESLKPPAGQAIPTPVQAPSQPSTNSQQVAGQPANVANRDVISGGQKESIFMRLSNRIKSLELNLSLSSQYLEELSKRYRKQMDQITEMQKIFNKSMGALNETSQWSMNETVHLKNKVENLERQILNLTHDYRTLVLEKGTMAATLIQWHIFLVIVELIAIAVAFVACFKFSTYNIFTKFNELMQKQENLWRSPDNNNHADIRHHYSKIGMLHPVSDVESKLYQKESPVISSLKSKNGFLIEHGVIGNDLGNEGSLVLKAKKKNRSKKHSRSQSNDFSPDLTPCAAGLARNSVDNSVCSTKIEQSVKKYSHMKHSSAGVLFDHVPKIISMKISPQSCNENKTKNNLNPKVPSSNLNRPFCNKFSVLADIDRLDNISNKSNYHRKKYF